ncbi:unnamed protein product, partial [Symbiodinium sp. KB8]
KQSLQTTPNRLASFAKSTYQELCAEPSPQLRLSPARYQPSLCITQMLRMTWMLSAGEVASMNVAELSDANLVDDSARLDSILELQLVLLPYSATSQTQAEELATFFDTGSVFEARFGRALRRHPDMVCDHAGSRPLLMASARGHVEVARLLLEAGEDSNLADNDGFTALMAARQDGYAEVASLLLEAGADRNLADFAGFTALMLASKNGHIEVVRLLLDAGADGNFVASSGATALMVASATGNGEVARLLLEAGADRNLADKDGFIALMVASLNGHSDVVLGAGADRNLADNGGLTALMLARHGGVGWLLQEAGFDNNSSSKRRHCFFDDGIPKRPR